MAAIVLFESATRISSATQKHSADRMTVRGCAKIAPIAMNLPIAKKDLPIAKVTASPTNVDVMQKCN